MRVGDYISEPQTTANKQPFWDHAPSALWYFQDLGYSRGHEHPISR